MAADEGRHKCLLAAVTGDDHPEAVNTFDAPGDFLVAQRQIQITDCNYPLTNSTGLDGILSITLRTDGGSNDAVGIGGSETVPEAGGTTATGALTHPVQEGRG